MKFLFIKDDFDAVGAPQIKNPSAKACFFPALVI